jgi:hypothetical protein
MDRLLGHRNKAFRDNDPFFFFPWVFLLGGFRLEYCIAANLWAV